MGSGTVVGNVINNGMLIPGPDRSVININGNYSSSTNAVLEIQLANGSNDRIDVSGTVSLAGKLRVMIDQSFLPIDGTMIQIISSHQTPSGTFTELEYPVLPNGYTLELFIQNDGVFLKIKGPTALSVTLFSFDAQKQNHEVLLSWEVITERNQAIYEIQRSADAHVFEKIGEVLAKNLYEKNWYSFLDHKPNDGHNYYRIKMIDTSGKAKYTKVQNVVFIDRLSAYPNPVSDFLILQASSPETPFGLITNAKGQIIKEFNASKLDFRPYPQGVYILTIYRPTGVELLKVIKE